MCSKTCSVVLASVRVAGLSWVLSAAPAVAQHAALLQGLVVDELTDEVISAARVTIVGTELETRTSMAGEFAFSEPPGGTILVRVEADGYAVVVDKTEIGFEEVVFMQVALPPMHVVLDEILVIGRSTEGRRKTHLQDARSAADLLVRQVSGVFNAAVNVRGDVQPILLRGVKSITLSGEPMVLLDGVLLGGTVRDALDVLRRIPVEHVKQIRVLRGPSAAFTYGSANGAILVETRSGPDVR